MRENNRTKNYPIFSFIIARTLIHAGFVVNIGGATAQDVLDLIAEVQKRVYEKHGVKLYPEVKMIGEQ